MGLTDKIGTQETFAYDTERPPLSKPKPRRIIPFGKLALHCYGSNDISSLPVVYDASCESSPVRFPEAFAQTSWEEDLSTQSKAVEPRLELTETIPRLDNVDSHMSEDTDTQEVSNGVLPVNHRLGMHKLKLVTQHVSYLEYIRRIFEEQDVNTVRLLRVKNKSKNEKFQQRYIEEIEKIKGDILGDFQPGLVKV